MWDDVEFVWNAIQIISKLQLYSNKVRRKQEKKIFFQSTFPGTHKSMNRIIFFPGIVFFRTPNEIKPKPVLYFIFSLSDFQFLFAFVLRTCQYQYMQSCVWNGISYSILRMFRILSTIRKRKPYCLKDPFVTMVTTKVASTVRLLYVFLIELASFIECRCLVCVRRS